MAILVKRIKSLIPPQTHAQAQSLVKAETIPVAGYERNLHITQDGIVSIGGGEIYYTNAADELIPVLITDPNDVLRNAIRTQLITEISGRGGSLDNVVCPLEPPSVTGC